PVPSATFGQGWMAGAGGIEPPHAGIKIRCLTAWRRPSRGLGIDQPERGANPAKWPEGRHFCPVAGGGGHGYKGASRGEGPSFRTWLRRVAQPGRALRSGRRGRRFESSLSDHIFKGFGVSEFPAL